jgi:zinc transport system substrate-binding protein
MGKRRRAVCLLALLLCAWSACAFPDRLKVFVSILPEAYLVERVGGEYVEVGVLVGPGQNFHVFEPAPKQLAELSEARLYFRLGLAFETRLLEKIHGAQDTLKVVDAAAGVPTRPMTEPDADEAAPGHADHGAHEKHGGVDPHIWLSPPNLKIMAANVCAGLREADPAHAAEYDQNLAVLQGDIDAAHKRVAEILKPLAGHTFYVYHPEFGYFADLYNLKQVSVEMGGKEPTARQLVDLVARAKADHVRVIFVQRQFPKKSAEALASEIGGVVQGIDPLARDVLRNLEDTAKVLANSE